MSYQYINPIYTKRGNIQYTQQMPNTLAQSQYNYVQNPYTASFYNQAVVYPFNPLYMPNVDKSYCLLGQFNSPSGDTVNLFQLSNGQKVAIMPTKDKATIVKTFLDGGSMNEDDELRGISHCIEHCLFKGSSKLKDGDVFKRTSLMGASTNASTDYAQTDYYITAPYMSKQNLSKTIEIQGDMVSNPTFEAGALESEKGPICSEISMINDDPITVAFDRVIRNLFQIKSDSHNLVAGSIDTVSALTKNNLVNHHSTYYTPDNLYTVVMGDVDVNETIDLISKNFTIPQKSLNAPQQKKEILTPITKSIREDIRTPKTNYTTVMMGFAGPKPQDSKDFIIASMLDYYLSDCSTSHLKNELEDISADFSSDMQKVGLNKNDPYALVCAIGVNAGDEQKGIDIFFDAIQKLQSQLLSDDDMTAIKNHMYKSTELASCSSENLCNLLGSCLLDGSLELFSNYREIINSITKEDIMNFARKYYNLNKVSMVVIHPNSVSKDEIEKSYQKSKYSISAQNKSKINNQISFGNKLKISTDGVEEYILPNNTHIVLNDTNSNLCAFSWSVNTPPIKPKNPNIPAVLRYMFQKGTDYRNQSNLERFKELNGISADVVVNGKRILISADCMPENADKTLSLMSELMFHPTLTQNDFEKAKKYVKDSLISSQKDAESNLLDKIFPGHFPTKAQKLKTIDSLQLDDVKEFYREVLASASSNFVATAPFGKNIDLKTLIVQSQSANQLKFKSSTPKLTPIFTPNPQTNVVYDVDVLNQAQIYKSYNFPLSGNIDDEVKFEMVNTILGGSPNSRLFSDLREKQNLAYSVFSSIQSFENTGVLTLGIQTTTDHKDQGVQSYDNVKKSLEGFEKHTKLLCNELVSDDELEAAKMKLKQNVIARTQNPLYENNMLAINVEEPYGIKRIDKYIEAIDNVTKEDIQEAARFIFSYNPTISILASEDTINSQMNYLKTLGKVQAA